MLENFIFLCFKFFIFYIFFFLAGRSFFIINNKFSSGKIIDEDNILGLPISIFYPIIGIFLIGNFLFLLNFIIPLDSFFTYLIILFLVPNLYKKINLKELKNTFFSSFLISFVLLFSTYGVNFHYDAGSYHLLNQAWIRESNIILGFSNIFGAFGVSSIWEYVSSFLWIDGTYVLLHFLNLIFILFFYQFLVFSIFGQNDKLLKNSSLSLIIFSILDNFGFGGGRNGFLFVQGLGKQDMAIAILYLITSLLILISLIKDKYELKNFIVISTFTLFLYQLKISSFPIVILFSYYIFKYVKKNNLSFRDLTKIQLPYLILFLFWMVKSILQTGCLIFPATVTCFQNLSWVDIEYTRDLEEITVGISNSYYFTEPFSAWLREYLISDLNRNTLYNFFISLGIVALFLFKNRNSHSREFNFVILFFILVNILFFLRYGPDPRYLIGLQMLSVAIVGLYIKSFKFINKFILISIFLVSLLLLPRLQYYQSFNFFVLPSFKTPNVELVIVDGVSYPKNGDQCWNDIECFPNYRPLRFEKKYNFFQVVYVDSKQ